MPGIVRIVFGVAPLDDLMADLKESFLELRDDFARFGLHIHNPLAEFWKEFSERVVDMKAKPGKIIAKLQKALFKVCHEIVKRRYTENDPDNARHADLIALFMFNFWNVTGLLPMTQALVILGSELDA